jgi:hypothetical protein
MDNGNNNSPIPGSLRAAIIGANADPTVTQIFFTLADGTHLDVESALPAITAPNLFIVSSFCYIDGTNAGSTDGLVLQGNNISIYNVGVINFQQGAGVRVEGANDHIIQCAFGTSFDNPVGKGPAVGNNVGIYVDQVTSLETDGNTIGNNFTNGIEVHGSSHVTINDSWIKDNGLDGVRVIGNGISSPGGFTTSFLKDRIIRNHEDGIHLMESSGNRIGNGFRNVANTIGCDVDAFPDTANFQDGVRIESYPGAPSTNNVINLSFMSGNDGNGVALVGAATTNNSLINSYVGIAPFFGSDKEFTPYPLPNLLDGVVVSDGANNNQIGEAAHGNTIAANIGSGVRLSDPGTIQNTVQGNYIGLYNQHPDGNNDFVTAANNLDGVTITDSATNNMIGGAGKPITGPGNVISGNLLAGVHVSQAGTIDNDIQGNYIGTDPTGLTAFPNLDGVLIDQGASNDLVGGNNNAGVANVISGNTQDGVHVSDAGTSSNQIQGNLIGTEPSGTVGLGNVVGVFIEMGASDNTVGGVALPGAGGLGNVISANVNSGVVLAGSGTTGNAILANRIGTNVAGTAALGNGLEGVQITLGASGNTVGGISDLVYAPGNLISGNHHDGVGIAGIGTTGNLVQGNQIGTNPSGLNPIPNQMNGVLITLGATGNYIGGGPAGAGNLISGNKLSGVVVSADGNFVIQNMIGTTTTGLSALPNDKDGVDLLGGSNGVGENLISGNLGNGVVVNGSDNIVVANKIGTNITGTAAVANQHDGVFIDVLSGPGGNFVGGPFQANGNLISGNAWNGIDITGPASAGNQIEGNDIGTDVAGKSAVGNLRNGILVNNTTGYTIGGDVPAAGNLISGNRQDGVAILGSNSRGIVVLGNRIGTDVSGMGFVPNLGNGVHIDKGANGNTIGGTLAADGNLISGNALDGVFIAYYLSEANQILGNQIGTDISGLFALPNGHNGVEIQQAGLNYVGGDAAGAGNLISGNKRDGVRIAGANGNFVAGNLIGTDFTGTKALPNDGHGVDIRQGAQKNTIGGIPMNSTSTPGNVISGNLGSGVVLNGVGTNQNLIEGNDIGTAKFGGTALGNHGDGVVVLNGASANQIGGSGGVGLGGAGNLLSGNAGDGVRLFGLGTNNNLVQGNWIGTDASGQAALGNGGHGVWLGLGAQHNTIGGIVPANGNVIAHNGKAGVAVGTSKLDANTLYNTILSNSIYSNLGLGIDLGDDGVTVNTPGGPHVGPNSLQNTPVIASAQASGAPTTVVLSLNSKPLAMFTIQIFANAVPDPTGSGQGKTLVATLTVTTDAAGNIASVIGNNAVVVNGQLVLQIPQDLAGQYLTATATDSLGNTSEFSRDVQVAGR